MEIALVLGLMAAAVVLFALDRVPVDVVALAILAVLLVTGVLSPAAAFAGFGSDAVIAIAGLFVLSAGLRAAGALDLLARWLRRRAVGSPRVAFALLLVIVAAASAFMNNTACTALFLPIALLLARSADWAPSRILMPVAFASILGGSLTLVGTSTNVIVGQLLPLHGQPTLGMFELTPVALPIAVVGIAYLLLASGRLLPAREATESLTEVYALRQYVTEVALRPESPLVGTRLADADLRPRWDLSLLSVVRHGVPLVPSPDVVFADGDLLLVQGEARTLLGLGSSRGFVVHEDAQTLPAALAGTELALAEAVVQPRSDLLGRTLSELDFRRRFGANVLAVTRGGASQLYHLARIRIRVGDVLLLHGPADAVLRLQSAPGLVVLNATPAPSTAPRRPWLPVAVMGLVVALHASGALALPSAVLLGALLLFVTRCVTPQEAYAAVDWRMLVLIAGMIGYGTAMTETGAAAFLAHGVLALVGDLGPVALLACFYLLTLALTQPMSNQAAALVVLPLGMEVAAETGFDPRAMAVTIALAASSSFLTPLEPSCLLVYGPGRYRFFDFARLGAGLTLLALVAALWLIPRLWPA